jgi:hypothetical protein
MTGADDPADLDPDDVPDANRPATEVAGARITKAFKSVVKGVEAAPDDAKYAVKDNIKHEMGGDRKQDDVIEMIKRDAL